MEIRNNLWSGDNYWIYKNTMIVKSTFNHQLYQLINIMEKYNINQLIFSDNKYFYETLKDIDENIYPELFVTDEKVCKLTKNISGSKFNQTTDNIPEFIKKITFGQNFVQSVDNLSSNITHLSFTPSSIFNNTIENLPCLLTHLVLGNKFDQSINNLPQKLNYLVLGQNFSQLINNIPHSIEYLVLHEKYNLITNKFPSNLKTIICNKEFAKIHELTKYKLEKNNIIYEKDKKKYFTSYIFTFCINSFYK